MRGIKAREALYVGLVAGAGNALIVIGIAKAGIVLYSALLLSYALFMALFAVSYALLRPVGRWGWRPLGTASLWTLSEWCHAQLPFAAPNILGDSQSTGFFLPLARLGGTYLLTFIIILCASLGVSALEMVQEHSVAGIRSSSRTGERRSARRAALWLGLGLAALQGWAFLEKPHEIGSLKVSAVQGGVPTWLYARSENPAFPSWKAVPQQIYVGLTLKAPPSDLIVWPETALWRVWGEDEAYEQLLKGLLPRTGAALLVGTPRRESPNNLANSAVLLQSDRSPQVNDKRHLALLAEAHMVPAASQHLFELDGVQLGTIFCLETVVPRYARQVVQQGARLVVVLAEGSRFGSTPVGALHAGRSVVRAVEIGRGVVHAGQHGESMLIRPDGSHEPALRPYQAAVAAGSLPLVEEQTPYVRWGPWIVVLAMVLMLAQVSTRLWGRSGEVCAGATGAPPQRRASMMRKT